MTVFVALLRAVNVGGRTLPMADLRGLCETLGFEDVRTFIQSGNVVLRSPVHDRRRVREQIEAAIEDRFGFKSEVMIRTAEDLRRLIARNPFPDVAEAEPTRLVVAFLTAPAADDAPARLEAVYKGPERARFVGEDIYVHFPNGQGESKLTPAVLQKASGVPGTARNWNTVGMLLAMAEALEGS